jgi:hypothetical protein
MCNVSNWLSWQQLQTKYEVFFELMNDVDQEQEMYV